jgi:hypothetical protein
LIAKTLYRFATTRLWRPFKILDCPRVLTTCVSRLLLRIATTFSPLKSRWGKQGFYTDTLNGGLAAIDMILCRHRQTESRSQSLAHRVQAGFPRETAV